MSDPPTASELERLRAGLRIMALVRLRDSTAAEEAAQESLVRVLAAVEQGRVRQQNLGAFARGVANHVIVDALRRRNREFQLPDEVPEAPERATDALTTLVDHESAERVRRALASLSFADRVVLRLSYFEGLSPMEAADRLGVPPVRLRKQKQRALDRLRHAFLGEPRNSSPTAVPGKLRVSG